MMMMLSATGTDVEFHHQQHLQMIQLQMIQMQTEDESPSKEIPTERDKGGVARPGALKILALPNHSTQIVIICPQKVSTHPPKLIITINK